MRCLRRSVGFILPYIGPVRRGAAASPTAAPTPAPPRVDPRRLAQALRKARGPPVRFFAFPVDSAGQATDLKSVGPKGPCGFESHRGHFVKQRSAPLRGASYFSSFTRMFLN